VESPLKLAASLTRRFTLKALGAFGFAAATGALGGKAFGASKPPKPHRTDKPSAKNVRVVGYTDVDGRPPFKMAIQEVGGRWFLYAGHLWHQGWSIIDVTDPANATVAAFVPGPANTWTIQMDVNEGKMITALERKPPSWGGDPAQPFDEGVLIWDLADPVDPRPLGQFHTGGTGTHRDFYAGGRYVHLAAGMPGYAGNIYLIIDISDPANPIEVGRWAVPGQHVAAGETPEPGVSLHGPAFVVGDLAYLPYGGAGFVILDISIPSAPTLVSRLDFSPPFLSNIGLHSALPLPSRGLAVVNSEAIRSNCDEALNHVSIVDVANPAQPRLLSMLPVPTPPKDSPFRDFCEKGGRFGPHNLHQNYHSPFVEKRDDLIYLTYFNAGLRIYDISNQHLPREVGYFIPPDPTTRFGPQPPDTLVLQSEDVLVDARGYIYLSHKNQGLWILKLSGPIGSKST
jgi:hypothetical protein